MMMLKLLFFLGRLLHDLGMIAHRENHQIFSVSLAASDNTIAVDRHILREKERAIITAEALHAIYAHESEIPQFTIEAGCESRGRVGYERGPGQNSIYCREKDIMHFGHVDQGCENPEEQTETCHR